MRPIQPARRGPLRLLIALVLLAGFASHQVAFAAGTPSAGLTVPPETMLGQPLTFTASFDNTGTTTGYGPYLDLTLPAPGADGAAAGTADDDGVTFASAAYLGSTLTPVAPSPFICTGSFVHPLTKLATACTTGAQIVILRLPFGSFTPDQPRLDVIVNANLSTFADLGTPLQLGARAGFMYGADPLDNPVADPPIMGATTTAATTPTLLTLRKRYVGPEDETATGPNFQREYQLIVDIAAGQTLTNLDVTDLLPPELQYVTTVSATPATCAIAPPLAAPSTAAPQSAPNNRLTVRCASVTGTLSTSDAVVTLRFFVPRLDAAGAPVLPPATADDKISADDAKVSGGWTPLDPRDAATTAASDVTFEDHRLEDQAIAIQKSYTILSDIGGAGVTPGDTLQYTLDFQVSDYFAFGNVVVDDLLSDGLHFEPGFMPKLDVAGNSFTLPAADIAAANYTHDTAQIGNDTSPATDGSTHLSFRVGAEVARRNVGSMGRLVGGCIDPLLGSATPTCSGSGSYNDGATTGHLVYRAVVQENFTDTYPSNDQSVDQGDRLTNRATIAGAVLSTGALNTPTGYSEADDTAAVATIVFGQLTKSIYAINGSTALPSPLRLTPGDAVTYRLRYTLPSSDFEGLRFVDYLPLPVYSAPEITTFDPALAGTVPAAGRATYGPSDTYHLLSGTPAPSVPTLSTTAPTADNTLTFTYGNYDDAQSRSSEIDLLFTATVSDAPFADGLLLTNQVRAFEASTNAGDQQLDAIVQITLAEPDLRITKGAVATDNPAGTFAPAAVGPVAFSAPGGSCVRFGGPITSPNLAAKPMVSDLSNVDAGDRVTFALAVENVGGSSAFDVKLRDALPAGFAVPAAGINLCVTDGTGAALAYSALGGGLLDPAGGIQLTDPGATTTPPGAIDPGHDGAGNVTPSGRNIAIITYDLVVDSAANAGATLPNTAVLFGYAGQSGGRDHTTVDRADTATVTLATPLMTKTLVGTEFDDAVNSANEAVVGELVRYRLTVRVPEGITPAVTIADTLDSGLAFVDMVSVTPSAGVSFGGSAGPTVTGSGRNVAFNLGAVTNADADNAAPNTIMLEYRAVVLNVVGNQAGTLLRNSAALTWDGHPLAPVAAANTTVIEPVVGIAKTATPTSGDAGDTVSYTIEIAHGGASGADAFDITFDDPLPLVGGASALLSPTLAVADTAGLLGAGDFELVGSNAAGWTVRTKAAAGFDLPYSATRKITLTVSGTLANTVTPGLAIANTATARWTSLDGAVTDRASSNTASDERTGAGGVDDYSAQGTATVTIFSPAPVKSIVATSEAHTSCTGTPACTERLAIGEIVRYRLVVRIAEGSSPGLRLTDRLPAGLRYLDGTARVALVSTDPGVTSSTLSGAGLLVLGNEATQAAVTPTFTLPAGAITGGPFVDGTDPTFALGNLTNTDSDADQEFAIVEFNALVDNVAANQAFNNATGAASATTLSNDFQVLITGSPTQTSNAVAAQIAEPLLTVAKTVSSTPADAGDTAVYQIVVANSASGVNRAPAFDVAIRDQISADLELVSVSVTNPAGTTVTDNSILGVGGTVQITLDQLPPTADIPGTVKTVTVTLVTRVANTVVTGRTLTNTVTATYTSLPGAGTGAANPTGSVTPGASGDATGERSGAGAVNDYTRSSTVSTVLATPAVVKLAPAVTRYTIGELVTYDIKVTLPEGVTNGLVITDDLPVGLGYASYAIVTTAGGNLPSSYDGVVGAPTSVSPATTPGASGQDAVLTFPPVTTADDNIASNNAFLVRVTAVVLNVLSNQTGVSRVNTAQLAYTNAAGAVQTLTTPGVTITLQEPILKLTKTVSAPTPVDGGDTVTYQLVLTHDTGSQGTAYDAVVTDALPAGLGNGLILGISATGVAAPSSEIVGGIVRVPSAADGSFDLPQGATVTITVGATLTGSVTPAQTISNTGALTWSTLDGAVAQERIAGSSLLGAGGLDDYEVRSTASLTTAGPAIAKALVSTSDAQTTGSDLAIGEIATYDLRVTLPEGTTPGLTLTDLLPAGLEYVSSTINTAGFNGTLPTPSIAGGSGDGADVTFTFGSIAVVADNITANNSFVVSITARTSDTAANVGITPPGRTTLGNSATLQVGGGAALASNAVVAAVVEPRIVTTKSVAPTADVHPGATLTYTVRFANTGTAPAYAVTATDTLPAGVSFGSLVGCAEQSGTPVTSRATGASTVTLAGDPAPWTIAPGNATQCIYTAVAGTALALDSSYSNVVDADWRSQPAAIPGARSYDDSVVSPADGTQDTAGAVFRTSAPTFAKTADRATATIGERISYTLRITTATGTLPNLVVGDTLPAGLIVDAATPPTISGIAAAPTFAASTPNDGSAPVALTWTFGDALVTQSPATITYSAIVADVAGNHAGDVRTNAAALHYSDAAGVAKTLTAASSVALAEPALTIAKTAGVGSAAIGDVVQFQIVVRNAAGAALPAYDVVVDDLLPAGLSYEAGSLQLLGGSPAGILSDSAAPRLRASFAAIDPGETATITYRALLDGTGARNRSITNTATATWTSRPGAVAHERTGAGGVDAYATSASATVAPSAYTLTKTLIAPAGGLAGVNDPVQFAITITNTGSVRLATVPLADSYAPAWLQFTGASVAPNDTVDDGALSWSNVGPLEVDESRTVLVSFTARAVTPSTINVATVSGVRDALGLALAAQTDDAAVQIGAPDLQISKSDGGIRTTPGGRIIYTLSYRNAGLIAAKGAVIAETVPANTTFAAGASSAGWSCADGAAAGMVCRFALGTVAPSGSGAVSFAVDVVAALPAGVTALPNTATIADDGAYGADPMPADNTSSVSTPVDATPDLQLGKSDGGVSAMPGTTVVYELTYTNVGNQFATGVLITETVPANTSFATTQPTAGWSCAGATCTLALPDLAPGATGTVSFAVMVDTPLAANVTELQNTATIADDGANGADPTPDNNRGADTTPITGAAPGMTATKAAQLDDGNADGDANPGETLRYTVVVANSGNQNAAGVVFGDTPGANTALVAGSVTTTQGTVSVGNTAGDTAIAVQLGALPGGASATITFSVRILDPLPAGVTSVANQGQVTGGNFADVLTDDPATGAADDSTITPVVAQAVLELAKTDGGITARPGDTVVYTLSYRNTGDQAADGLVLREVVPANTRFSAASGTAGWSCADAAPAGSECTRAVGTLAGHAGGSVTFAVTVDTPLPNGTLELANTVVLADAGGDLATAADTTPLRLAPDLRLTKTDGGALALPGGTLTYQLGYSNAGTTAATNVFITETVPANTTFAAAAGTIGWSCSDGAVAGTLCTLAIGNLPVGPGGSVAFGVTVVNPVPRGVTTIDNTATIADDGTNGADPVPSDNTASVTTLFEPTAIGLVRFTAAARGGSVTLDWTTSREDNVWGFALYRSSDGAWDSATRVTPAAIPATGRTTSGASYLWVDTTAATGQGYTYWLQELSAADTVDTKRAAAPDARAQLLRPIFLPFVAARLDRR